MSLAACQASGKDWSTPWSVMAMAGWPQLSARLTTALASVSASMADMRVCKCSSTRFSGALSILGGSGGSSTTPAGSNTTSPSNWLKEGVPCTCKRMPGLTRSTMGFPVSPAMKRDTRTEL